MTQPHPQSVLRGALLSLAAFGIFATHDLIIKFLGASFSPVQIVFFTVLFSFPFLLLVMIRDTGGTSLIPVHPWWTALRSLSASIGALSAFYAFTSLPLTQVYAILFTTPLLVTLLSIPILGERVGLHRALAVLGGLIGVMVVLQPGTAELQLSHLAAFSSAFFAGLGSVIMRKIGRHEKTVVLQLYPLMLNLVLMAALLPLVYVPPAIEDLGASAVVAALGLLAVACLLGAYRAAPAAVVAPMQYSQIIWAALFGWLFFSETPNRFTAIGTGIIIASGLYIVARELLRPDSNQPVLRTRSRGATPSAPRLASFLNAKSKGKPPSDGKNS